MRQLAAVERAAPEVDITILDLYHQLLPGQDTIISQDIIIRQDIIISQDIIINPDVSRILNHNRDHTIHQVVVIALNVIL